MPTIFRDKVTCGEVTFNDSSELPLETGVVQWGLDVLLGWNDTPEMEASFAPIGTVDGEVAAGFFPLVGRELTVGGFAHAEDRATAESLMDVLVRDAFPRNTLLEFARYEPIPKFVSGYRVGKLEFVRVGPTQFRWATVLRAPDPFKYALTAETQTVGVAGQSTGGRTYPRVYPLEYNTVSSGDGNRAAITNSGTANVAPVVTLHGPLESGGWRLVNETTGEMIKFDVGLASSADSLEIDFANETALLNGFPVSATITGDFWRVIPGLNIIKLYADYHEDAGFTIVVRSGWE